MCGRLRPDSEDEFRKCVKNVPFGFREERRKVLEEPPPPSSCSSSGVNWVCLQDAAVRAASQQPCCDPREPCKATLCQGVSVFSSINMPHGRWEEREPVGCLIGLSLTENG